MAERSDITVEWGRSPRIIMVKAPSTTLVMQDLVDTCRGVLEESWAGMEEPILISAGGKEELEGSVNVGITVTLLNAKIAFESRHTALVSSTATLADVTGTTLTDTTASFLTSGLHEGDTIINFDDTSSTTIKAILSDTQILTYPLAGGMTNGWQIGDQYKGFGITVCQISGGNLAAVDALGVSMDPLSPTAFTFVKLANSSSATLVTMSGSSISAAVWNEDIITHSIPNSAGEKLLKIDDIVNNTGLIPALL